MKKSTNFLKSLLMLFAAAILSFSCTESDDKTNTESGGTPDGDDGNQTEQPAEYTEINVTSLTQGELAYYGAYYTDDTTNWTVTLTGDDFDFNEYDGSGEAVILELNSEGGATDLIPGRYTVVNYDVEAVMIAPFTAVYGYMDGDGNICGTWYLDNFDSELATYYCGATRGVIDVEKEGDIYTITFDLYEDEDRSHITGSYTGTLIYYDGLGDTGGEDDGGDDNDNDGGDFDRNNYDQLNITGLTQGEAIYYGAYYVETSDNWVINLAGDGFNFDEISGDAPFVTLELNTEAGVTDIPAGTYTVMDYYAEDDVIEPFTAVYGYTDEEGTTFYGSWFFENYDDYSAAYYGATAGTVTVSKSGDNYTISFDIYDDNYYGHVTGSYTGTLTFYDESFDYASAQSVAATAKHRGIARKMNVVRKAIRR